VSATWGDILKLCIESIQRIQKKVVPCLVQPLKVKQNILKCSNSSAQAMDKSLRSFTEGDFIKKLFAYCDTKALLHRVLKMCEAITLN
jgi:hypothetical protein